MSVSLLPGSIRAAIVSVKRVIAIWHPVHRRAQIDYDAIDGDVHVRSGVAADELGQCKREKDEFL